MFQSGAQFMFLVAVAGLFLLRESHRDPTRSIDESFADFLAIHARREAEPAPVTLVAIDESSLAEHPWPWKPLSFALFFQTAQTFQPEVVATDALLHWDATADPQQKIILRENFLRASKVLISAQLGYPEDPSMPPVVREVPIIRHVSGNAGAIPEFTAIEAQADEEFRLSSVTGFTNLPRSDRFTRTVPLVLRYHGQIVPSFVLQAILLWEKLTPDDVKVVPGDAITLADRLRIPIDEAGRLRVDFGVRFGRCGFDDLVLASDQLENGRKPLVPADTLTGKFLLLTRTDPAARTVPFAPGRRGSEGELFAAAIGTIQSQSFIHRAPFWFELAFIAAMMLVARACRSWRKLSTVLALLVGAVAYGMIAITVFGYTLVWLPIVLPAGLTIFIALFRIFTPGREPAWMTRR